MNENDFNNCQQNKPSSKMRTTVNKSGNSCGITSRHSSSNEDIDQQSIHIVKANAEVHHPLSMVNAAASTKRSTDSMQSSSTKFAKVAVGILTGGIVLGSILPKNQTLPSQSWQLLSNVIGYTYFLAWSTSFYPQILLNYDRR